MIMKQALLLLLLLPALAFAEAKIVVSGPTEVVVGELIRLDLSQSEADSFRWVISPSTEDVHFDEDIRMLVISCRDAVKLNVVIAAAKEGKVDILTHVIDVAAPTPANDLLSKIKAGCESVDVPNKRDDLIKLAQNFSNVAKMIEEGTIKTPAEAVTATTHTNRDTLAGSFDQWAPLFDVLQKELLALRDQGALTDTASHGVVWRDISKALTAYYMTL
jgi:hypothetical protein